MLRHILHPVSTAAGHTRRQLWVAASSADTCLAAAASQCTKTIAAAVRQKARDAASPATCFALVSQTYSAVEIDRLSANLTQQLAHATGQHCSISGTVVEQIIGSRGTAAGLSLLFHRPERGQSNHPFYIGDQHGRQRLREVAVGRWHTAATDRFKTQQAATTTWQPGSSSVTRAASHLELPPELQAINDPSAVHLVLFAADKETRQVLDALDARFPRAAKLGIVGAQTPFVNGREFTLLASSNGGNAIYESGVVGVAFSDATGGHELVPQVTYRGLVPVSDVLRIERCKGNVVLELEHGDRAHSLIAALRRPPTETGSATDTDGRLFARVLRTRDAHAALVFQVTGGNPAKGGLALDTLRDLSPGSFVQLMMLSRHQPEPQPSAGASGTQPQIHFGVAGGCRVACPRAGAQVVGAATEGGFCYGGPMPVDSPTVSDCGSVFSGSTECAVPGSTVTLTLE
ncbi:hypothetical protein IWW55_004827 [Coemansia sp. RSA 2706]|nr:hypothetical protein IWW55_004827 [Coemansia sp. RSA 2706]KAJ2312490.1 hypothetical protein IWW54_002057 [Coemansia sp. RSA 2705]KAJ2319792.1 hypothetical protein IWW52_001761 [Coemansia sp. RSA 2704]